MKKNQIVELDSYHDNSHEDDSMLTTPTLSNPSSSISLRSSVLMNNNNNNNNNSNNGNQRRRRNRGDGKSLNNIYGNGDDYYDDDDDDDDGEDDDEDTPLQYSGVGRHNAEMWKKRSDNIYNLSTVKGTAMMVYNFFRYTLMGDFQVAFRYVHTNSKKNFKSFLLGLLTVFLVVLFISFLQNLIQASPIVFLKLSEDQTGELDLVLTGDPSILFGGSLNSSLSSTSGVSGSSKRVSSPQQQQQKSNYIVNSNYQQYNLNNQNNQNNQNNNIKFEMDKLLSLKLGDQNVPNVTTIINTLENFDLSPFFVNSTLLTDVLVGANRVHGVAPRWLSLGNLASPVTNQSSSLILLVMNTELEKEMGLGRGWNHPPLTGNEAHISNAFLRRIKIKANDNQIVNMHVDFIDVLQRLGVNSFPTLDQILEMIDQLNGGPLPQQVDITLVISYLKFQDPDIVQQLQQLLGNGISEDGNTLYPTKVIENLYTLFRSVLVIDKQLKVMDGIDSPGGKYPSQLGNVAVLDSSFVNQVIRQRLSNISSALTSNIPLIEQLVENVLPIVEPSYNVTQLIDNINRFSQKVQNFANGFQLNDYSMSPIVMMENRVAIYTSNDNQMKTSMIDFTNQVSIRLGINYPALFTTPLATTLAIFQYTKLSLNQVFNCVAAVLLVLGALMIYSLLLSDVEGKTFEYGMLRAQGLRHYALIILLLTQAIYFSVPGILAGLFIGWSLFAVVAHFVYQFVILPVNLTYYPISIWSGVLLGFCLPIIANIAPIQRALSRTLRDALDVYHQVKNETMVRIEKLEDVGLDVLQTILALLAVGIGFTVYYLIPYAFTFYNFDLFFGILTAILLGMLFGLSLLAQSIQPTVEKIVLFLMVWGPDRKSLYNLVKKNLTSHGNRNSKTATMFTICLTFVIFTGSVFRLQGYNIQQLTRLGVGTDISVYALSSTNPVPEDQISAFLDNDIANNSDTIVSGYTVMTFPLDHVVNIKRTQLSTLADYPYNSIRVYGVQDNFLENVYLDFYRPTEESKSLNFPTIPTGKLTTTKSNVPDIIKSLYTNSHKDIIDYDVDGNIRAPPDIISRIFNYFDGGDNNNTNSGEVPQTGSSSEENGEPNYFGNEYVYENYTDIVLSEAFRAQCGATTQTPLTLHVTFKSKLFNSGYAMANMLTKTQSMVEMFPSLFYSAYGAMAPRSPILLSLPQFESLMQMAVYWANDSTVVMPEKPPKSKILIRLKEVVSEIDREYIINGLKNFINTDTIQVLDTQHLISMTDTAVLILDIFFYTVSGAAIVLCFFMLSVSFSSNIHENSWEFGVLRAIGLTNFQVTRIYIYEALTLIFSSVILGLLIGLGVAITLTLQIDLFTQLPFSFQFPYFLFFGVFASSIIIAIIVSYQSSKEYRTRQIASVLKGK